MCHLDEIINPFNVIIYGAMYVRRRGVVIVRRACAAIFFQSNLEEQSLQEREITAKVLCKLDSL